jgi:hypothetical protein
MLINFCFVQRAIGFGNTVAKHLRRANNLIIILLGRWLLGGPGLFTPRKHGSLAGAGR